MTEEERNRVTLAPPTEQQPDLFPEEPPTGQETPKSKSQPPPLTDPQKLDELLGLARLLSNHALETNAQLGQLTARVDALVQHVGGVIAAQTDLRPRVEFVERETKRIDNIEKLLSATHDLAARTAEHVGVPKLDEEFRAPIRRSEPAE